MKNILLVLLLSITLIGCKEPLKPIYKIGDNVVIENKIEGIIVEIRTWIGASTQYTADYNVMIGNSVVIWYDEEQLVLK